jgi:uncharacterized protein YbjT (DUF2867 family)
MAKVFLAGASGVIGDRLIPMLRAAGHEVTGTTRSPEKAAKLKDAGADPVVLDATDNGALTAALEAAAPEVVINQLTDLPKSFDYRDEDFAEPTNKLRGEVGPALAKAAAAAGAKRLIAQSVAFFYDPEGDWIKD